MSGFEPTDEIVREAVEKLHLNPDNYKASELCRGTYSVREDESTSIPTAVFLVKLDKYHYLEKVSEDQYNLYRSRKVWG